MATHKIRLPSINDIFPQPQQQQQQQQLQQQQQQQQHLTQRHHSYPVPTPPQSTASSSSRSLSAAVPTTTVQVIAPHSPISYPQQSQPQYDVHSPVPMYYYQSVYYGNASPQPMAQAAAVAARPPPPHVVHAMSSSAMAYSSSHSPIYQPPYTVYMNDKARVTKHRQSNAWTDEDDTLLKYLKDVRNLGWREISMHFRNRTANGCQFRWRRISALAKAAKEGEESESEQSEAGSEKDEEKKVGGLDKLLN